MSRTTSRRYAKRVTRQLWRNMDTSLGKIQSLREVFDDDRHDKHVELLTLIAQMQIQIQEFVGAFYKHAWGDVPGDWYADVGPQH